MSNADSIRAGILAPDGAPNGDVVHEALAALDALVSENQRLRDALKQIAGLCVEGPVGRVEYGSLRHASRIATAALDGTPTEATT